MRRAVMSDTDIRSLEREVKENDTHETRLRLARALERVGRVTDAIDAIEPLAFQVTCPEELNRLHGELRKALWRRTARAFPGREWRASPGTHYVRVAGSKLEWAEDDGPPSTSFTNGASRKQTFLAFAREGPLDETCPEEVLRELVEVFHLGRAPWVEERTRRSLRESRKELCPRCGGASLITDPELLQYKCGGFFDDTPEACGCGSEPRGGEDLSDPYYSEWLSGP
jgi:hypothetical protein